MSDTIRQAAETLAKEMQEDFEKNRSQMLYFGIAHEAHEDARLFLEEMKKLLGDAMKWERVIGAQPVGKYLAQGQVVRPPDYVDDDIEAWRDGNGDWHTMPRFIGPNGVVVTQGEVKRRLREFERGLS